MRRVETSINIHKEGRTGHNGRRYVHHSVKKMLDSAATQEGLRLGELFAAKIRQLRQRQARPEPAREPNWRYFEGDARRQLEADRADHTAAIRGKLMGAKADVRNREEWWRSHGTKEFEAARQIIDVALDRAFLLDPLPTDEADFKRRVDEGRGRLTLIANEVARLAGTILIEYAAAVRKLKDTKNAPDATADVAQQLQRLMPKQFIAQAPWAQLAHFPRYLKAITLRLDKYRADPARDAAKLAELRPQEQRYWRLVAERKGAVDARMQELRWLLEELRVSFFAQELRTPQPVSVKRLDKLWAQVNS